MLRRQRAGQDEFGIRPDAAGKMSDDNRVSDLDKIKFPEGDPAMRGIPDLGRKFYSRQWVRLRDKLIILLTNSFTG